MGIILVESDRTIIVKIREAFLKKAVKNFYKRENILDIQNVVKTYILSYIKNSETWNSLQKGVGDQNLSAHFGIPSKELDGRLERLLDIWGEEIKVTPSNIKRRSSSFVFSYKFYAIEANWAKVLNSDAGVTINVSKAHPEGQRLPFLEWLLVAGDQLEITGYDINFGNHPRSRSGSAVMIKANTSWVVPPEFGGFSESDNFVTRALDDIRKSSEFRNKLETILKGVGGDQISQFIRDF